MDFNREASIERQTLIAAALGVETDSNRPDETAARAADAIREIVRKLGIKNRLRDWGVKREDLPHIADGTMTEFLLATNPREVVSPQEVVQILENVF
jgi:alcohol dehydrogenase class IV